MRSATPPYFHRRHPSFTSQTCVSHLHALICVQTTPQIPRNPPKPTLLSTTGTCQSAIEKGIYFFAYSLLKSAASSILGAKQLSTPTSLVLGYCAEWSHMPVKRGFKLIFTTPMMMMMIMLCGWRSLQQD